MDGTEKLCQAVYGRGAAPRDYLGGSNARMLSDAADTIEALRRACEAVLIFHNGDWAPERSRRWGDLAGGHEATTRVLCDLVRMALMANREVR